MPNILFDTSSIINLINGESFDLIFNLKKYNFYIGPLVNEECIDNSRIIYDFIINGKLFLLDENIISLNEFSNLLNKYNLGDGETECIAIAKKLKFMICSDDKKARNCIEKEVGKQFVTGTIYLLKQLVINKIITCEEAFYKYNLMILSGGFLPTFAKSYFCK